MVEGCSRYEAPSTCISPIITIQTWYIFCENCKKCIFRGKRYSEHFRYCNMV